MCTALRWVDREVPEDDLSMRMGEKSPWEFAGLGWGMIWETRARATALCGGGACVGPVRRGAGRRAPCAAYAPRVPIFARRARF